MASKRKKKIVIVMPAYNAEKTLRQTHSDIPEGSYDEIILVDDASRDDTVEHAKDLGIIVKVHTRNKGYGGNQKTCYTEALKRGADVVIMLHPDNQYDPGIVPNIALPILEGQADVVLASRFIRDPLKGGPIKGGMPVWKFIANRALTIFENFVLKTYFSEFHTGYRAFSRKALESVRFMENSDNFVFDNEIIVQLIMKKMRFKEIGVRTRYFKEASSVDFFTSTRYGLGILKTLFKYILHTKKIKRYPQFE